MEEELRYPGFLILLGTVALRSLSSQLPTDICALLNNCLRIVHSQTLFHWHYGKDSLSLDLSTIHQLSLSQKILKLPFSSSSQNITVGNSLTSVQTLQEEKHQKLLCIKSSMGTLVEIETVCQMYGFPVASRTTPVFWAAVHTLPLAKLCVQVVANACRQGGTA